MSDRISIGHLYPSPIPKSVAQSVQTLTTKQNGKSFQEIFNDTLKLSHHAEVRLKQRVIQLQPDQLQKINHAIEKAAAKGAKESLVLMSDMALIVNVKSKTIVTVMDGASIKDNIFTQIDSAVII
jgi:flagellar operon protein